MNVIKSLLFKLRYLLNKVPKYIYVLLFVSFIVVLPAKINSGVFGHDSSFHMMNILSMDFNTSLFEFPTRIRPLIANGFGYGTGIFYPQLFHFLVFAILKIVKLFNPFYLSSMISLNIFLFLLTFLISLSMRTLLHKYTSNKVVSTIGAILYILYPYFITDIYVRSAYPELFVFLSLPLIFLGLYYLFNENNKYKFYIFFVLGFSLIFSSHLISSVYTIIFTGIFILCNFKKLFKNKNIIHLGIASIFVLLITLDFLVPILEHKLFGNYLVFNEYIMSSKNSVSHSTLPFDFLFIVSDSIGFYIPMSLFLLALFGLFNIKKLKQYIDSSTIIGYFLIFIISFFLVISSDIWFMIPSFLINIQFAWRLCGYICFSICVMAAFGLSLIPKRYFKIVSISSIVISLLAFLFMIYYPNHIIIENEVIDFNLGAGVQKEYLPVNTFHNLFYFNTRNKDVLVINGDAKTKILENDTPYLKFKIDTEKESLVEIPRIFYLWYNITLTDQNKNKIKLDYYENEYGFIEFLVPESGIVTVEYKKSLISFIAAFISIISLFIFPIYLYILKRKTTLVN